MSAAGFKFSAISLASGFKLGRSVVVLAALLVGACTTRGGAVPYEVANFGAPDVPVAVEGGRDYRIGQADVLSVAVFNVPEFSGDFTVDDRGRIQMPLVGDVAVIGRTPDEAAADLRTKLGATYLKSPNVQVQIKSAASKRITIDGSVGAPGIYPVSGGTTLLQAVALAKGTTDTANPRRTVIFRTINGQRMAAAFDLTDIRRGTMPNPEVFADDIIVVDGSKTQRNLQNALSTIPILGLFTRF